MAVKLYQHQELAIKQLKSGSILCGGVGSGKSLTSLGYFHCVECGGSIRADGSIGAMTRPRNLYIITTARKRDTFEWDAECRKFLLPNRQVNVVIDSWNNIGKYVNVCGGFFILDEQKLVGSGAWVKAFYQIVKKNRWILLSATPGDRWLDYIPVFIANGFYKNKTQFLREHVVFNAYVKYPKVQRYINVQKLIRLRNLILVNMDYVKVQKMHHEYVSVDYDEETYNLVVTERWNPYEEKPIKEFSSLLYLERQVVNRSASRLKETQRLIYENPRLIIFYNFDYELELLRPLCEAMNRTYAEWNGHKHMPIPETDSWVYLVHYTAGAEGWNCISTNTILFFSLNYSYRIMLQAAGRIDRLNSPYSDLYAYYLVSSSPIDKAIQKALSLKKDFNMRAYYHAT